MIEDLERLITEKCPQWYVYNFGEAYRQLDAKMHMATTQMGTMMQKMAAKAMAPAPEPAVEKAPEPEKITLTEDETEKMAALSTKISAMSAASEDTIQSMGP